MAREPETNEVTSVNATILEEAIAAALESSDPEAIQEAVETISDPGYARFIGREGENIFFNAVRDEILTGDLKAWETTAESLDTLFTAIREKWSKALMLSTVNHVGPLMLLEDRNGAEYQLKATIRNIIEDTKTYQKNDECRERFDALFDKFGLLTKEEVIRTKLGSGRQESTR